MGATDNTLEKEVTIDGVVYRLSAQPAEDGVLVHWFCEGCRKGGDYGPFDLTEPAAMEVGIEKLRLHQAVHHSEESDGRPDAPRFQFTVLTALFGTLLVAVEMGAFRAWGLPGAAGALYFVMFSLAVLRWLGLRESWGLPLPNLGIGEVVLLFLVCLLFVVLAMLPVWH